MVGSIFFLWCLLKLCYLRLKIMWGRTSFKLTKKTGTTAECGTRWTGQRWSFSSKNLLVNLNKSAITSGFVNNLLKKYIMEIFKITTRVVSKQRFFFQAAFVAQWILYLLNLNEFYLQSKDFVVVTKIKNDFFKLSI